MSNYDKNKDSYWEDFRSGFIVGFCFMFLFLIMFLLIFAFGFNQELKRHPADCVEYGKFKYENIEYSCNPLNKILDKTSDKIQNKP